MLSLVKFTIALLASSALAGAAAPHAGNYQDFTYAPALLPTVTITVVEIPDWCLTPSTLPTSSTNVIESTITPTPTEIYVPSSEISEPTPEPTRYPEPEPEEPSQYTEVPEVTPTPSHTPSTTHQTQHSSTPTPTPTHSAPPTTNNGKRNVSPFSLLVTSIVFAIATLFN